jgi:hypothetical protein
VAKQKLKAVLAHGEALGRKAMVVGTFTRTASGSVKLKIKLTGRARRR